MPIYEYLCERCGKVNEVIQKLNEKPPRKCDECGATKLAKLVSRSAFQLKGGGWYADLYSSRKPASAEGASASSSSASASGSSAGASTSSSTATSSSTSAASAAKPAAAGKEKPAAKKAAGT